MHDIIEDAQKKRFKVSDEDPKKQAILISDTWLQELQKHPYHSSKILLLTLIGKPGTGIFLIKESAKLYKSQKNRTVHTLSKRLGHEENKGDGPLENRGVPDKRMKDNEGRMQPVGQGKP